MWVYFNMPEARYLELQVPGEQGDTPRVELQLANWRNLSLPGKNRSDRGRLQQRDGQHRLAAQISHNPDNLLRHGQTGTILLHRKVRDAVVIPQRATYEILAKQYVFVVEAEAEGKGNAPMAARRPRTRGTESQPSMAATSTPSKRRTARSRPPT